MARRATSLGPKPSLFIIYCFWGLFFPFLSLLCNTKNLVLPLEKGIFCLFLSVSLCFSLAFFGLPLFQFFFLCLSLRLVLFPSFLSFFFAVFCFRIFVSFYPFLSSLLLFHEENNIKIFNYKVFLHQSFLFFGFLSFFSLKSLFLIFLFLVDFKLCFVPHHCFWFQKKPS